MQLNLIVTSFSLKSMYIYKKTYPLNKKLFVIALISNVAGLSF